MTTKAAEAAAPAVTGRARLVDRVADHVLRHGSSDLSLSELARAVGSNNRMLLYYFGSKEEVLREATLVAFARYPRLAGALRRLRDDDGTLHARLTRAWADIAHPDNLPFLALFFQAFAGALYRPERNRELVEQLGGDWVGQVRAVFTAEGIAAEDAHLMATQVVAAWRGLQLDLLSGASRSVLDRAYAQLVDRLVPPGEG